MWWYQLFLALMDIINLLKPDQGLLKTYFWNFPCTLHSRTIVLRMFLMGRTTVIEKCLINSPLPAFMLCICIFTGLFSWPRNGFSNKFVTKVEQYMNINLWRKRIDYKIMNNKCIVTILLKISTWNYFSLHIIPIMYTIFSQKIHCLWIDCIIIGFIQELLKKDLTVFDPFKSWHLKYVF